MKEKQVHKKIWPLPVKNFEKLFLWHQTVLIMNLTVDRQVCVIKTVAYSLRTDRHTHRHTHTDTGTDKSLKTEGPKILSNDIFYFRTVIIGGPTAISMVSGFVEIRLIWIVLGEEKTSALVICVFHVFTVCRHYWKILLC